MNLSTDDQEILVRYATELRGMTRNEVAAWHLIYDEAKEDYEMRSVAGTTWTIETGSSKAWSSSLFGSQNIITTI
jgi:hypothetical protein